MLWYCCLLSDVCPDLPDPGCGAVSVTGNSVGDVADYLCHDGCRLVGSPTLTCKIGGKWSHKLPVCTGVLGINVWLYFQS